MIINSLTGYMLGNSSHIAAHGDQWWPINTEVYICQTLQRAKEILMQSHNSATKHFQPVWTTIYRVKADKLPCTRIKNGLIYTNETTRIFVDEPVYYKGIKPISEKTLLSNASKIRKDFFNLVYNNHRGK